MDMLKDNPVKQGATVTFNFPNTLTPEQVDEIENQPHRVNTTCGCTGYTLNKELGQISFNVKAPTFMVELKEPYLKTVTPIYTPSKGDRIKWEIKFYVI